MREGFPGGSDGKESACNVGVLYWEDPLEEGWQPTPIFLPGECPWSLAGYSPWGSQIVGHDGATKHSTKKREGNQKKETSGKPNVVVFEKANTLEVYSLLFHKPEKPEYLPNQGKVPCFFYYVKLNGVC